MYHTYTGMSEILNVEFVPDDVATVGLVVDVVGVVVVTDGELQDTPAASLSEHPMKVKPRGHSSKLFSLPVHSHSVS